MKVRGKYVTIEHASAVGVAQRWKDLFFRDDKWCGPPHAGDKYDRLVALGDAPPIAEVAEITGNKSWSYISCKGCADSVETAVRIGSDYSETNTFCRVCIAEAAYAFQIRQEATMKKPKQITDGHKLYALCVRNHAHYIVGPFESYDTLGIWSEHEEQNGDDPRWQSIELTDDALMPTLHGPDWHPGYTP